MLEQSDRTAQLCATIEEELGTFRRFEGVPSTELEDMAARIARAVAPLLIGDTEVRINRAA